MRAIDRMGAQLSAAAVVWLLVAFAHSASQHKRAPSSAADQLKREFAASRPVHKFAYQLSLPAGRARRPNDRLAREPLVSASNQFDDEELEWPQTSERQLLTDFGRRTSSQPDFGDSSANSTTAHEPQNETPTNSPSAAGPLMLDSAVEVRSDMVLVRDHLLDERPRAHLAPIKTLSEHVRLAEAPASYNELADDEPADDEDEETRPDASRSPTTLELATRRELDELSWSASTLGAQQAPTADKWRRPASLTLARRKLLSQSSPQVRSASSGIRVTLGNGTRPLIVNSLGLITAVKSNATTGRPYNPAQLFASSSLTSHTLEPIEIPPAGPGRQKTRPPTRSKPIQWTQEAPTNSSVHLGAGRPHELLGRPASKPSHSVQLAGARDPPAPSHDSGQPLQSTSTTAAAATTAIPTTTANFQHNPPYKQTLAPPMREPLKPAERNSTRPNDRFQLEQGKQQAPTGSKARPISQKPNKTAPYEPSSSLAEPANLQLQTHQLKPLAPTPVQSNATILSRPTKVRVRLHNLLRNTLLNRPASEWQQVSGSMANNMAQLIGQRLGALVRPGTPGTPGTPNQTPQNSLFGFRVPASTPNSSSGNLVNRFKQRVNPFAAPSSSPASWAVNRRTAGVGSLLVSGLLYGLTVLPALMALTGINPLTSGLEASPGEQAASSQPLGRKTRSNRRPGGPSASATDSALASSDQSNEFAYLIPLLASANVASHSSPGQLRVESSEQHRHQTPAADLNGPHEAQSSALKSLYAPPPTIIEPAGQELGSLLEDQNELDWPIPLLGRPRRQQQQQRPPSFDSAGQYHEPSDWTTASQGARRHRDLMGAGWPNSDRAHYDHSIVYPMTSDFTLPTKEPTGGSFDDRVAQANSKRSHQPEALASVAVRQGNFEARPSATNELPAWELSFNRQPLSLQKSATSVATLIQVAPPSITSGATQTSDEMARGSARPYAAHFNPSGWSVGNERAIQGDTWAAHPIKSVRNGETRTTQSDHSDYHPDRPLNFLSRAPASRAQELGDDFAILGPFKVTRELGQVAPLVAELDDDTAIPRRRRNLAGQPQNQRQLIGRLVANDGQPTDDEPVRAPPLAMSENGGWRAINPPPPSRVSTDHSNGSQRAQLATRSGSQVGEGEPSNRGRAGDEQARGPESERRPSVKKAARPRPRKRTRRRDSTSLSSTTTSTTTSRPRWLEKDDAESELLLAHSMAMGSRVLNEQLADHH